MGFKPLLERIDDDYIMQKHRYILVGKENKIAPMYNYGANMTLQSHCDQITEKELGNSLSNVTWEASYILKTEELFELEWINLEFWKLRNVFNFIRNSEEELRDFWKKTIMNEALKRKFNYLKT